MLTRRRWLEGAAAGALLSRSSRPRATGTLPVHEYALAEARRLAADRTLALKLMYPEGSLANLRPIVDTFAQETSVRIQLEEVPLDGITEELLLEADRREGRFDVAVPASFGIPDLVEAGVLLNLDRFAQRHEPAELKDDALFSLGDHYKGSLYGYQTDGDAYLMFYRSELLNDVQEQARFADEYGYELKVPRTWDQLDAQMAFFHRPGDGLYGGALYRNRYVAWEWWLRFHAKGCYPFADDLTPQIDSDAGVAALEALTAASRHLYPRARQNGLFENFIAFGAGDIYCNIGWGGTQKHLNSDASRVRGKVVHGTTPGAVLGGRHVPVSYFNWGWNYVVSSLTSQPELSYLFALFAASPTMSTRAVRQADGFFDPFRRSHYADPTVVEIYSRSFLDAHQQGMSDAMPDLYLKGQVEYFDELTLAIQAADRGEKTPRQALADAAGNWNRITERMGSRSQQVQWQYLKSTYPEHLRRVLK